MPNIDEPVDKRQKVCIDMSVIAQKEKEDKIMSNYIYGRMILKV